MTKALKKAVTLILVLILVLSLCPAAMADGATLDNFSRSTPYDAAQFTDVAADKWYGESKQQTVRLICELGLMTGTGNSLFSPEANMTLAEAVALAVRVNRIYIGLTEALPAGEPWYQPYVDQAVATGIIAGTEFSSYTVPATRAQMAYIFSRSVPGSELAPVREVASLPDVNSATPYSDSIFQLYRAGVLSGGDAVGTFGPNTYIQRSAAAAIVARIALPAQRQTQALETYSEPAVSMPVWSQAYAEGMRVSTMAEVESLLYAAFVNQETYMDVYIEPSLLDRVISDDSVLLMYADRVDYTYNSLGHITMSVFYSDYAVLSALELNRDVVVKKAAAAQLGYDIRMDELLVNITSGCVTDYEKAKAVHDYMVSHYRYDEVAAYNVENWEYYASSFSLTGLLDNNTGVCQAYSQFYALAMQKLGIEAYIVVGLAGGGDHSWNIIALDGEYYQVDVTWDDPLPDQGSRVIWDYFLITDAEMAAVHSWDHSKWPACNGTKY